MFTFTDSAALSPSDGCVALAEAFEGSEEVKTALKGSFLFKRDGWLAILLVYTLGLNSSVFFVLLSTSSLVDPGRVFCAFPSVPDAFFCFHLLLCLSVSFWLFFQMMSRPWLPKSVFFFSTSVEWSFARLHWSITYYVAVRLCNTWHCL